MRKRPRLARVIRPSEWPALSRRGLEPTVFINGLTYAEREYLRSRFHYSGAGDDYIATFGRELPRVLAALTKRPEPLRAVTIRLEWPRARRTPRKDETR